MRAHPHVDILVNNLGIFEPKPFEDIPDSDWLRFFEVNVVSGARLARLYLPGMKRANWGRIIFISSESGLHIPVEMIHYGVTKSAQISLARGIAEAVAGTGITVNSVLPGPTKSRGVVDFVDGAVEGFRQGVRGARDRILRESPTDLADQALRLPRRGRGAGRLCREPARLGHHRSGAAGRRRGGQERVLRRDEFRSRRRISTRETRAHEPLCFRSRAVARLLLRRAGKVARDGRMGCGKQGWLVEGSRAGGACNPNPRLRRRGHTRSGATRPSSRRQVRRREAAWLREQSWRRGPRCDLRCVNAGGRLTAPAGSATRPYSVATALKKV